MAEDADETLLSVVFTDTESNARPIHLRLKGLDAGAQYELIRFETFGCEGAIAALSRTVFSGSALLRAGLTLPPMRGDYAAAQLYFRRT